jgi:hypothetical protein
MQSQTRIVNDWSGATLQVHTEGRKLRSMMLWISRGERFIATSLTPDV